jgi:hypothetical protein
MMNRLILIGTLWCIVISISGAQEADTPKQEAGSVVSVPALEQPANEAASADERKIVVVLGPDATPSEDEQAVNIQKAFDSLKARNLLRFSTPEDDPKKVIVTLGFHKEDTAEGIENLLIDLWQLDIPELTISLRRGTTIQIETGNGCYAHISNFEDLDRRQIVDLWEFFQKPERKQKFDALFLSGSHAYSKPSVPPPHPASPSTVSLKVERGLARDAIEITRALEKKGGLVSFGVDEEANAILVDSRDGFLEEARVLLRKWQDYYHPVPVTDGKTAGAEPTAVSVSNIEAGSGSSKAIVLVIDADAQQSEVVKQVVEALEKAGVATTRTAETEPFANSSISVTLGIRKDVSHEHVTLLVKELVDAGVHSVSFREGLQQGEEHNRLDVRVEPGYSESELARIYSAVETVKKKCGLTLLVATNGLSDELEKSPSLDANLPEPDSSAEATPVNGQPSPFRPLRSETPRRVAEPKRIVIQPGVDAQESEVMWQFMADLEKAGIAKVIETEMTPTSESPIVTQVFMREDESFERIKLFLVDLRASGVEKLVLEFGGLHPEGDADKQHNGLVFRATKGYSQDELQRLEKVVQAAAERCGLSLYSAGTHVLPSGPKFVAPPDKVAVPSYAPSFRPAVPQLRIDYEAANKQAYDLAESLRQTPDAAKKAELRTVVQRAFTLRQSLLRAELQEMQARLEKTQQSLAMRDRMADQIVDRRVEDLLNPQLKWDDSALPSTKDSSPKIGTAARYNADADGYNSPERTGFSEISLRIPEKQFVPDPGTPALRVTYDDLDLFKILNMEPVPANAVEYFPDWLQALNGKTVRIRGFMYPTFEAHSLKQFTLARHNDICCFVRNPKIYDVIGVSLGEGITTDYIDGRPFDVEGTFNIEPKADENRLTRLYRISEARILPVAAEDMDSQTEDLSNVQSNEVNDYPIQVTGPNNSSANASAKPEIAQPVTELEGHWHLVTDFDHQGEQREMSPTNWTFRGDQRSIVWPGGGYDCRIKVDPIKKTLWSYSRDENGSYGEDYYELKGNQLILRNKPDAVDYEVFERGHVRIPSVVPLATQEQIVLWRSAIVEIVVFSMNSQAPRERVIGRGVVISSDGKILSQMSVIENGDLVKEKIKARFDDGTVIPLKLIEEAGQGWSVLLPELPIHVNHYFELSTSEVQLQDEVRVWGPEDSPFLSESLAPFGNTVTALDRKYPALGIAVWQLRFSRRPVLGTPILDADGDLLGMTITGAQDLLLAIPVAELKAMFPKSLGLLTDTEKPAEPAPIP